jgi:ankyrin repeat protein
VSTVVALLAFILALSACSGDRDGDPSPARNSELIAAARAGDADRVRSLLERGADVHARDANGATSLVVAAYGNHVEVARELIEAGADVNAKDETEQSTYLIATSEVGDDPRLLELTLANGADVDAKDSYNGTGLIRAADRGYAQIVERLLETKIAIDHVNRLGWTALLEAIILGTGDQRHTDVVRLLVDAGADVNLADGQGVTPLAHARRRGFDAIATILERAGARP